MPKEYIKKLKNSYEFYRNSMQLLAKINYLLIAIVILLAGVIISTLSNKTPPKYFAATSNGKVVRIKGYKI